MPTTQRLQDTFNYLHAQVGHRAAWLTKNEIDVFQARVRENDLINAGASLSLNWSWNNTRPAQNTRKAIRAYIMISIYNGHIDGNGAGALATLLKTKTDTVIHNELRDKVRAFVLLPQKWTQACSFIARDKGHDGQRTVATSTLQVENVRTTMRSLDERGQKVAVMLIDMQTKSDTDSGHIVTGDKMFDGKSHIEWMKMVLDVAVEMDLIVYDIVIDSDAALTGNQGVVRTIPTLTQAMPVDDKHKFMPKAFYNSFQDTPLENWLEDDDIDALVVMGFDANLCVKNTIFGTPGCLETVGQRDQNPIEKQKWIAEHPCPGGGTWRPNEIPQIAEKQYREYLPGLLDRDIQVITSRAIIASCESVLDGDYADIAGL